MSVKKVSLFFLASLFGLVLIEILLRGLNYPYLGCKDVIDFSEFSMGQFDSELGWSYKRHFTGFGADGIVYIFNDEGYRTDNQNTKTDFSKPIILIVGNSAIFGDGVNYVETFGYKLQNRLNNKYEVINMAVQGYGLDQAYLRLKQIIAVYKPKYVILDFIEDYDNRNINRDRRSFTACVRASGSKPLFWIQDKKLFLKYKPEKLASYDSPRIRLVERKFMDVLNQGRSDKKELTKLLYMEMEKYVKDNNSKLLTINYWADIRDFQKDGNDLGIAFFPKKEGFYLPPPDGFHPNEKGTSGMVEAFLDTYSSLFSEVL